MPKPASGTLARCDRNHQIRDGAILAHGFIKTLDIVYTLIFGPATACGWVAWILEFWALTASFGRLDALGTEHWDEVLVFCRLMVHVRQER